MASDEQLAVESGLGEATSMQMKGMRELCLSILMEAEEKCEEIDVKCEEEFRSLKWKEIVEQRGKVDKALEKRKADVDREYRVFMTKLSNQSRLAQLKAKNDIVKQIMDETKARLCKERSSKYIKLLKDSMTQALFMLMEREVKVMCKKNEKDLVASCFPDVVRTYESTTNLRIKMCIANETLSDKNTGGVIVCNMTDEVSVDCQLDSRVEQVCREAMPLINDLLFADVKVTDVVRDSTCKVKPSIITASSKSVSIKFPEDEEMLLKRGGRSPVPLREQGVTSSTIALPVHSPSSNSRSLSPEYAAEPAMSQTPGTGRRRESSGSMVTATPSPQRTLQSPDSMTISPSPPPPPEKDDKKTKRHK